MDLSGINNVGEFYSHHYLEAALEGDLKQVLQRWHREEKEEGRKHPARLLNALADRYFQERSQARFESDRRSRWQLTHDFHQRLLSALGYQAKAGLLPMEQGAVPVVLSQHKEGRPYLCVIEAPFPLQDDDDAFDETIQDCPYGSAELAGGSGEDELSWQQLLDGELLRQEHPPRWLLYLGGGDVFLIDRYKWPQGRYLHFELGELFGRRHNKTMEAVAALLHCEVLNPEQGQSLHEQLDESSHKHAYAVSADLKYGAREAIEILANEVIYDRLNRLKQAVYSVAGIERRLTDECILYLYRLLFLFYVESRGGELGLVPMRADTYRAGYSLESLRDLEQVPLTSQEAQNGYFIHNSLNQLFKLMQEGFQTDQGSLEIFNLQDYGFEVPGLHSELFNPLLTPLLSQARLRNAALQKVLELLSLSRSQAKSQQRGRISYAQLGINQLGAVYEGLLSYSGFLAQEELIEVRHPKDGQDQEARIFFVPISRMGDYKNEEVVCDAEGRPLRHRPGKYLFRLAGRDREQSASYYTPEVLTRCLVRLALEERLKDLPADEILKLSLLEPAMGSGAFLNEALNQLADAYLERKQRELGQLLPAEHYQRQRQKVKYYLACHNVYGVDQNPRAVLLAEVSLWLNCLVGRTDGRPAYPGMYLGARLVTGNSLIGARRQVYAAALLQKGEWFKHTPVAVAWGEQRQPQQVYHFLLPDPAMAAYEGDKKIAKLLPEAIARLKKWRQLVAQPLSLTELSALQELSARVDQLWQVHLQERQRSLAELRQPLQPWGQAAESGKPWILAHQGRTVLARLDRGTGAGRRLQAVMDYWCSLWLWPVDRLDLLPEREEWLSELEYLMDDSSDVDVVLGREQGRFELPTLPVIAEQGELFAQPGPAKRGRARERLALVGSLAEHYHFHHWELAFPEVFAERGGFDLILGNPPWIRVEWQEKNILAEHEPLLDLRNFSAKEVHDRSARLLEVAGIREEYLAAFAQQTGSKSFLNAEVNYPLLRGMKANLYKCFLTRAFELMAPAGVSGLLHPDGVYDDAKGGLLRAELSQRLRQHFQFVNELKLFEEIGNQARYALNVYGRRRSPRFQHCSNLLHPRTLEEAWQHNGLGPVPGMKAAGGGWCLQGHRSRLLEVDQASLALFARLYDKPSTPALQARLPAVHSREIMSVLSKLAMLSRRFKDIEGGLWHTYYFDETAQQKDGTIARQTSTPVSLEELVLQGPHFYVANPLYKTPNAGCSSKGDYSEIDLSSLAADYIPRSNYVRACSPQQYQQRTPLWGDKPANSFYRHVHRAMLGPANERTLISAVIPPGPAHIDTVVSVAASSPGDTLLLAGLCNSLVYDFMVRVAGKTHLRAEDFSRLPLPELRGNYQRLLLRTLLLNALTQAYAPLWREMYVADFAGDALVGSDPRLPDLSKLSREWHWHTPLRTTYARRQALLEIDVIATLALGLSLEELLTIYHTQFGVLQTYDLDTWYDASGRVVFTANRGLSGLGLNRQQFNEIRSRQAGEALPDWAQDYVPPFDRCDREEDYARIYAAFQTGAAAD